MIKIWVRIIFIRGLCLRARYTMRAVVPGWGHCGRSAVRSRARSSLCPASWAPSVSAGSRRRRRPAYARWSGTCSATATSATPAVWWGLQRETMTGVRSLQANYTQASCGRGGLVVSSQLRQSEGSGFKSRSGQIAYFHGVNTRLSTDST